MSHCDPLIKIEGGDIILVESLSHNLQISSLRSHDFPKDRLEFRLRLPKSGWAGFLDRPA
jgi:hypothetical protein